MKQSYPGGKSVREREGGGGERERKRQREREYWIEPEKTTYRQWRRGISTKRTVWASSRKPCVIIWFVSEHERALMSSVVVSLTFISERTFHGSKGDTKLTDNKNEKPQALSWISKLSSGSRWCVLLVVWVTPPPYSSLTSAADGPGDHRSWWPGL